MDHLQTEARNPASTNLDELTPLQLVQLMNAEDARVIPAVASQAEAIARAIETCLDIKVPMIAAIIGEGGSGGAIALAAGNTLLMLEHAIYSVISPEGCASILWRAGEHAQEAAEALRLTAQDLHRLGVVDRIVPEPLGGAQRAPKETIEQLGEAIDEALRPLLALDGSTLRLRRREKFLAMGVQGL